MAQHNELGKKGEKLAQDYLWANGYEILETNYRFEKAEIDIIAQKDDTLVIIEVKTRSSASFGFPEEFISTKKEQLIFEATEGYIEEKAISLPIRFDVISILKKENNTLEVEHFKDAFKAN